MCAYFIVLYLKLVKDGKGNININVLVKYGGFGYGLLVGWFRNKITIIQTLLDMRTTILIVFCYLTFKTINISFAN